MLISLIAVTVLGLGIISYYAFFLPSRETKTYRLFEMRDKLSIYAMEGKVSQDSLEYVFLINLINTQINFIQNDIPYTDMFNSILGTDSDDEKSINELIQTIKNDSILKEVFEETTKIFNSFFKHKRYILYYCYMVPVNAVLSIYLYFIKTFGKGDIKDKKTKKREAYRQISSTKKGFSLFDELMEFGRTGTIA